MTKILVITEPDTTAEEALAPFNANLEIEPYPFATFHEAVESMRGVFAKTLAFYERCAAEGVKATFHLGYRKDYSRRVPRKITDKLLSEYRAWADGLSDFALLEEYIALNAIPEKMVKVGDGGALMSDVSPDAKWSSFVTGEFFEPCMPTREGEVVNECTVRDIKWTRDRKRYEEAGKYWDTMVGEGDDEANYLVNRYGTRHNFALCSSRFTLGVILTPDGEWLECPKPIGNPKVDIPVTRKWNSAFSKIARSCGTGNIAHVVEIEA